MGPIPCQTSGLLTLHKATATPTVTPRAHRDIWHENVLPEGGPPLREGWAVEKTKPAIHLSRDLETYLKVRTCLL
jgi:hypothetical protein